MWIIYKSEQSKFHQPLRIAGFLFVLLTVFSRFPSQAFAQVVINEFSVNPPDKQDWVEVFSSEVVDISDWSIGDKAGIFETVPDDVQLGPGIYYVFTQYQRLNNDKDSIYLYDENGKEVNSISYGDTGEVCLPSPEGSIARIPDGGNTIDRLLNHTKGQANGEVISDSCPIPTPTPNPTTVPTPTSTSVPTTVSTPTPKPTAKPTAIPTAKPTTSPTPKPEVLGEFETEESTTTSPEISLITQLELEEKAKPIPESKEENKEASQYTVPAMISVAGMLLLAASTFPFIKRRFIHFRKPEKEAQRKTIT